MLFGVKIIRANESHILGIKAICNQYKNELGFVNSASLKTAITKLELHIAVNDNGDVVGFVNWHRRLDGISTIYEIATHKNYKGKGIGRNLLWSVPCPIRLKVTTDNPANEFYQSLNMQLIDTVKGRKRLLNLYELKSLFIFCQGNNKTFPAIAHKSGVAYGTRSCEKAQGYPFMLDIKWNNYKWDAHIQKTIDYAPVMVCAPDYTDKSQYQDLMDKIQELRDLGVLRIVVIPKFKGAVDDIPNDCIIGISVPSSYAGYVLGDEDVAKIRGRMVHLLGGSPKSQMAFYKYYTDNGIHVISMDGNGFQKNASFGVFFEDGIWKQPKHVKFVHGDMEGTMLYSLKSMIQFFNQTGIVKKRRQLNIFDELSPNNWGYSEIN